MNEDGICRTLLSRGSKGCRIVQVRNIPENQSSDCLGVRGGAGARTVLETTRNQMEVGMAGSHKKHLLSQNVYR